MEKRTDTFFFCMDSFYLYILATIIILLLSFHRPHNNDDYG